MDVDQLCGVQDCALCPLNRVTRSAKLSSRTLGPWIDPLRKFSEGNILARLNAAGIKGVPKLIHEQQVQGPHPSRPDLKVNKSTHFIRTLLPDIATHPYHVRTLSRLITEPVGQSILEFSSLAELLLAFIDYVLSEC